MSKKTDEAHAWQKNVWDEMSEIYAVEVDKRPVS